MSVVVLLVGLFIMAVVVGSSLGFPLAWKIGIRNVRRRLSNTMMVVLGSMVGTALIAGSLVLSDSLDSTFMSLVEENVGEIDVILQPQPQMEIEGVVPWFNADETIQISERLSIAEVDGVLPVFSLPTTWQKIDSEGEVLLPAYNVEMVALDFDRLANFGSRSVELEEPGVGQVILSLDAAKQLEASPGDEVEVVFGDSSLTFEVFSIAPNQGISGGVRVLLPLDFIKPILSSLGQEEFYSNIYVSAQGGLKPDNYDGEEFSKLLSQEIKGPKFEIFESFIERRFEEDSVVLKLWLGRIDKWRQEGDYFTSSRVDVTIRELKSEALEGFGLKSFFYIFAALSFFGVAVGTLLIINLYSMLAQERKMEMGILRAIAFTRFQLMMSFLYEGFVYSLFSSLLGVFMGVAVGWFLVEGITSMFGDLFSVFGLDNFLEISFAFDLSSLVVAGVIGFLVTLSTTLYASFRVSSLQIVEAIRNTRDLMPIRLTLGWVLKTVLYVVGFLMGVGLLVGFFTSETNPDPDQEALKGYILFAGMVFSLGFAIVLLNRVLAFWKLESERYWQRITITIGSALVIAFTGLMAFESKAVLRTLEHDMGVGLMFMSGMVLVVSLTLMIIYNLGFFIGLFSLILRPFQSYLPVVRIALRYPSANLGQTGMSMLMFGLVIYLVVFISPVKATIKQEIEGGFDEMWGGYQVQIEPGMTAGFDQIESMIADLEKTKGVEGVVELRQTLVVLPDYRYKDLPQSQFYGDPNLIPVHDEDDLFFSFFNSLPADFLTSLELPLIQRDNEYGSDQEVWEAVISDPSVVVIGPAFGEEGFGRQPPLEIGQTLDVTDRFGNITSQKKIIGRLPPDAQQYPFIITTNGHVEDLFAESYLQDESRSTVLVKVDGSKSAIEQTNDLKKSLIGYDIAFLLHVEVLIGGIVGFLNALLTMFQGFLSFSLLVGTTGLGIIMMRAVGERRQQIGMLRSLGFQKKMIWASFILEATFITLLSILVGVSMGTISAYSAFEVSAQQNPDAQAVFAWGEVIVICVLVYMASMVFTLWPAFKAAGLSPVEATRYAE